MPVASNIAGGKPLKQAVALAISVNKKKSKNYSMDVVKKAIDKC